MSKIDRAKEIFDQWITIVAMFIAGTFIAVSYVHGTFLTKDEANIRKEARDKENAQMAKDIDEIKGTTSKIYDLLINRNQ